MKKIKIVSVEIETCAGRDEIPKQGRNHTTILLCNCSVLHHSSNHAV